MVYRLSALAVAAVLSGCASYADPDIATPVVRAAYRQQAAERYTNRKIEGMALERMGNYAVAPLPVIDQQRQAPLPTPVASDLRLSRGMMLGDVMLLWGYSIGYTPVFANPAARMIILDDGYSGNAEATELAQWLGERTGQRVLIVPESRLLVVTEAVWGS